MNHLRSKQTDLVKSMIELDQAKERLLIEEKLAAVGRFSTAIAHEIRNPVAMISSALTTASSRQLDLAQSQEMFDIAAKEAGRLERLTTRLPGLCTSKVSCERTRRRCRFHRLYCGYLPAACG